MLVYDFLIWLEGHFNQGWGGGGGGQSTIKIVFLLNLLEAAGEIFIYIVLLNYRFCSIINILKFSIQQ